MAADLPVSLGSGGPLFIIHTLQNGVFPVLIFNMQHCLLQLPFSFQSLLLCRLMLFPCFVIRKQVQLLRLRGGGDQLLRYHLLSHQVHPPHRQAWIHDAVKEGHGGVDDIARGGGETGQMLRAVGGLGDAAAIGIGGQRAGIAIGAARPVVANGEYQLPGHHALCTRSRAKASAISRTTKRALSAGYGQEST